LFFGHFAEGFFRNCRETVLQPIYLFPSLPLLSLVSPFSLLSPDPPQDANKEQVTAGIYILEKKMNLGLSKRSVIAHSQFIKSPEGTNKEGTKDG
jgi:hypothetical protein